MTIEEIEHIIQRHGATGTPPMLRFAISQAIGEVDELVSQFGGPVGREWSLVDLSSGRDTYPVEGFARIALVERLDTDTRPWQLSQTTPGQLAQAAIRMQSGALYAGFWAASGSNIIIWPVPTETTENGLRVWGYMDRALPMDVPPERQLGLSSKELPYVMWRSIESLSTDKRLRDRATMERERAELLLRRYIEMPTTGFQPDTIIALP